jgi:hypothetical protein
MISMRKEAVKGMAMVMSQNLPRSIDTKLLKQGCTNSPKIYMPPQNSKCHKGDMKEVP